MSTGRSSIGLGSRRFRVLSLTVAGGMAVAVIALLSGFHYDLRPVAPSQVGGTASEVDTTAVVGIRTFESPGDIVVDEDVVYATLADGTQLTLDVCSPPTTESVPAPGAEATEGSSVPTAPADTAPGADVAARTDAGTTAAPGVAASAPATPEPEVALRPAVLSVHGGSWARGDKANSDWRAVCEWFASEGFVAYSVNYRLVPAVHFPAAIDDIALAVSWMRSPANATKYSIDPARIGAFGGSAGGNLAALLGARGTGSLTEGSRVAAVAELSGPVDLSYDGIVVAGGSAGLEQITLDYLDCTSLLDCSATEKASAYSELDRSDPPVFIGTSTDEFIPLSQSSGYAEDLNSLGIRNELVTVPGSLHSIGILDASMREKVSAFLHAELGDVELSTK